MKKFLMPIIAAVALGTATPAVAYDTGGLLSMQEALGVAEDTGLVAVSHTQFEGDKWEIEGRDGSGRYMKVAVDVNTGDVLWVDR
jgi:peptidase YpeB-like protein